jgi:hypothetical protein
MKWLYPVLREAHHSYRRGGAGLREAFACQMFSFDTCEQGHFSEASESILHLCL